MQLESQELEILKFAPVFISFLWSTFTKETGSRVTKMRLKREFDVAFNYGIFIFQWHTVLDLKIVVKPVMKPSIFILIMKFWATLGLGEL